MKIEIKTIDDLCRIDMINEKGLYNPSFDSVFIYNHSEAFQAVTQWIEQEGYMNHSGYIGYKGIIFAIVNKEYCNRGCRCIGK